MKIYDWHTGPYPARVRIALADDVPLRISSTRS